MLRRTLTILSLIGLLLSVGLWGVSLRYVSAFIPKSLKFQVNMIHGGSTFFLPEKQFAEMPISLADMHWGPAGVVIPHSSARVPAESYPTAGLVYWRIPWSWRLGFRLPMTGQLMSPFVGRRFYIPFWIPTLLFAGILWLSHPLDYYRRRKRKKLGLCIKCGYDLRASKDICPECGEERNELSEETDRLEHQAGKDLEPVGV